jgi:epoxyqueuosine reductase
MTGHTIKPVLDSMAVKQMAHGLGFDAVGVCSAEPLVQEHRRFTQWLSAGRQGTMAWLTSEWANRAASPDTFLASAHSVVCVAISYLGAPPRPTDTRQGRIARYAAGKDYHTLLGARLEQLRQAMSPHGIEARAFVDTAPTMDKALARRAGLGWYGKHTNLINPMLGSMILLGGLVTDAVLEPDMPIESTCGQCRACIAVCPTRALHGDYSMDARRCISYLTIEHRGSIPRDLRPLMGDWVFGCDLCQDVCPPNTVLQDRAFPAHRVERVEFVRGILGAGARETT